MKAALIVLLVTVVAVCSGFGHNTFVAGHVELHVSEECSIPATLLHLHNSSTGCYTEGAIIAESPLLTLLHENAKNLPCHIKAIHRSVFPIRAAVHDLMRVGHAGQNVTAGKLQLAELEKETRVALYEDAKNPVHSSFDDQHTDMFELFEFVKALDACPLRFSLRAIHDKMPRVAHRMMKHLPKMKIVLKERNRVLDIPV